VALISSPLIQSQPAGGWLRTAWARHSKGLRNYCARAVLSPPYQSAIQALAQTTPDVALDVVDRYRRSGLGCDWIAVGTPINRDGVVASTRHLSVDQIGHDQRCPPALSSGDQPDQPRCGLRYRIFALRAVKKEEYDFGSIERQAFVWSKLDAKVLGQRSPTALAIELRHPVDIGNVGRESVGERQTYGRGINAAVSARSPGMVHQQLHAASRCSNSSAELTSAFGTS